MKFLPRRLTSKLAVLLGLQYCFTGSSLLAHHDIKSDMDLSQPIQIVGQIVAVNWGEPHSSLQINLARDNQADQEWLVQLDSIGDLVEVEFTASELNVGDWVAVILFVSTSTACDDRCMGYGLSLTDEEDNSYTISQQVYNLFVQSRGREA